MQLLMVLPRIALSRDAERRLRRATVQLEVDPKHCVFRSVSRLARRVTTLFDAELQAAGITAGHFTILMTLFRAGPSSIGKLADLLDMDATTVPRVLQPLIRSGCAGVATGPDRRYRIVSISTKGCARLDAALPHWERLQKRVEAELQPTAWAALRIALSALRRSANQMQHS